ncbi:hypothetical protein DPMN_051999 [Dreissena polymorpha]|uniref:Uncharacterized protein n=1 Tax=Dreissena polymorpha TaxID=45954 RepID=A0A9D4CKL1_DREPO|nr:hypothetical protein DPMN_051999 [Dreissena polymorpha]
MENSLAQRVVPGDVSKPIQLSFGNTRAIVLNSTYFGKQIFFLKCHRGRSALMTDSKTRWGLFINSDVHPSPNKYGPL